MLKKISCIVKSRILIRIILLLFAGCLFSDLWSQKISLDMIYSYYLFYPDRVEGIRSMKDGIHYTVLREDRKVLKCSYETGEEKGLIFSLDWLDHETISEISAYTLSDDETHILFADEQERIYRYSYLADHYVYDLVNNILTPVFSEGKQKFVTLSPDGRKVAFVYNNDLYFKDIATSKITRVTTDGRKNHIINGEPDWVYEEEFALTTGYYWSPDSRKLAYYRFDESLVKEYSMVLNSGLYPEVYTFKYPKAGEENSLVDIYVFDLIRGSSVKMETSGETDKYIPRIKWLPGSDQICITELNRRQNVADLYIADAVTGKSRIFYSEVNKRFVSEFTDDFVTFADSGKTALIMSEMSGYRHLYRYSLEGDSLLNPVTKGEWELDEFLGVDEIKGEVYYTSTEVSPLERYVYKVSLDGTSKKQLPSPRGVNTAVFSTTYAYYILTWSDANTPPLTALFNAEGELIRVLEDNHLLEDITDYFHFSEKEFFTFKNEEGTELNYYQILPPKFKPRKKYPLVVFVYGGPEAQDVLNQWDRDLAWMQYLAQEGYVVVCLDNRGTDGRGEDFGKSTYLQLGKLETEDQVAFARYMGAKPWIDDERIGMFGWSYGGYMSLLCLTRGSHVFNCGVAVAPISNWKFYDTVYTERFMGKPRENEKGYEEYSPINYAGDLDGELLLIHGAEDDNVHLQNTLEFVDALVKNNKQFDMIIYPGQNHHMFGENVRHHLYQAVDEFFEKNLKK